MKIFKKRKKYKVYKNMDINSMYPIAKKKLSQYDRLKITYLSTVFILFILITFLCIYFNVNHFK